MILDTDEQIARRIECLTDEYIVNEFGFLPVPSSNPNNSKFIRGSSGVVIEKTTYPSEQNTSEIVTTYLIHYRVFAPGHGVIPEEISVARMVRTIFDVYKFLEDVRKCEQLISSFRDTINNIFNK